MKNYTARNITPSKDFSITKKSCINWCYEDQIKLNKKTINYNLENKLEKQSILRRLICVDISSPKIKTLDIYEFR